jgi:hypothetical protein
MTLTPTSGQGNAIKLGNGASPEVFTDIEGVFNGPTGPGFQQSMLELRHHSSTSTVKKPTTVNVTPCSFSIAYDSTNTNHTALETASKNKTKKNFKVVFTDAGAAQYAFSAYVDFQPQGPVEGWNEAAVTLHVDGDITIT